MQSKGAPKSKHLHMASEVKNVDNKKSLELTFTAESKDALESHKGIRDVVKNIQSTTEVFLMEIQKLGTKSGLDIRVRPIFDVKTKGE